jgi:hypothetical protein
MRCYDSCCTGADERIESIRIATTTRKSRKLRGCAKCGYPIQIGDRYERVAMKVDGDFFSYDQHDDYCDEYPQPELDCNIRHRHDWKCVDPDRAYDEMRDRRFDNAR